MSLSEKPRRIRIISEEPKIASALRKLSPLVSPKFKEFWVGWVEDVEEAMRSREMMVSSVASSIYRAALLFLFGSLPFLSRLEFVRSVLGV